MKAEIRGKRIPAKRNRGGTESALHGAEADMTTRPRTKAGLEQENGLMDAVCERGNLMLAYQRVVKNKGAAGVDDIGIAEFKIISSNTGRRSRPSCWRGNTGLRRCAGWIYRSRKVG